MAMVGALVLHHYLADKADGRRLGRDEEASQDDGAKPFRAAPHPHGSRCPWMTVDPWEAHRLAGSIRCRASAGASKKNNRRLDGRAMGETVD